MNMVALVGNVASQPELHETSSGKVWCSFRIAVSRIGGAQADFLTIVVWERQAQVCEKYLDIGRRIAVAGKLRHTAWKTPEGESRSRVEIVANRVDFLGPRAKQATASADDTSDAAAAAVSTDGVQSELASVGVSDHDEVFGYDASEHAAVFEQVPAIV